jgi:hypothetical protein
VIEHGNPVRYAFAEFAWLARIDGKAANGWLPLPFVVRAGNDGMAGLF